MGKLVTTGTLFSDKSVNFLTKNAGKLPAKSIAAILHRTEKSIRRKAEKLGLSLKLLG